MKTVPTAAEENRRQGVTFKLGDVQNRTLSNALEKLDNKADVFNGKDLFRFLKIKNAYDSKKKFTQNGVNKLLKKHAIHEIVRDDDGKPKLRKDGKPEVSPKMQRGPRGGMDFIFHDDKAFDKDLKELMAQEFTVQAYCLLTEDLVKAGLTPKEIRACAKILSDADPEIVDDEDSDDLDPEEDSYPSHVEDDAEVPVTDVPEDSEPSLAQESPNAPRPGASASDTF